MAKRISKKMKNYAFTNKKSLVGSTPDLFQQLTKEINVGNN